MQQALRQPLLEFGIEEQLLFRSSQIGVEEQRRPLYLGKRDRQFGGQLRATLTRAGAQDHQRQRT